MATEFTVPDGIRPADLDRFLDVLISSGNMDQALRQADGDALELRRFARQCGYPSRQPMRDARTALRAIYPEIDRAPAAAGTRPEPAAVVEAKVAHPSFQPPASDDSTTVRVLAPVPAPGGDDQDPVPHAAILQEAVASVARAAAESGSKSLALAGERFVKAHDALVAGLRSHADEAAKSQRITELQAELARLRSKTSAPSSTAAPKAPSHAKEVRAWAAEQGIDCPKVGRVPERVQHAYDAAHEVASA